MDGTDIKEIVKEKYGQAALRGKSGSCCGTADTSGSACDPITSNHYDAREVQQVPGEAFKASLGCGNPTALAKLNPGEVVLDRAPKFPPIEFLARDIEALASAAGANLPCEDRLQLFHLAPQHPCSPLRPTDFAPPRQRDGRLTCRGQHLARF